MNTDLLCASEQSSTLRSVVTESPWKSQEVKMLCFICIEMNHFDVQSFIFMFILAEITYQI